MKEGKTEDALLMLDAMNFRKVGNVNAMMKAAEIYEGAGRREDARELLEIAHERSPIGRMIIYRLALVSIELGEYDEAKEYYDEFVEIAPHDNLKYIILYQLNKARGADSATLIGILEELKTRDFSEEWAYELAALYHKTGQADKCIDLCDEIILWFGDGPYVERAMELKMLYSPLNKDQAEKYKKMRQQADGLTEIRPDDVPESGGQFLSHTMVIPQVEVPAGKYDTQNITAEIQRNVREIMEATEAGEVQANMEEIRSLANDLPFLKETQRQSAEKKAEEDRKIDETLRSSFQNYLIEENDGQMSLALPEEGNSEPPMDGQLTIADIMAEWEKTRRAADKALKEAEQQKLENEKNQALEEANSIMEKLSDAAPRLESGATPQDLMKEEILGTAAGNAGNTGVEAEGTTAGAAGETVGDTGYGAAAEGAVSAEAGEIQPAGVNVEQEPAASAEGTQGAGTAPVQGSVTGAALTGIDLAKAAASGAKKVSGGYVIPHLDEAGADIPVPEVAATEEHIIGKVPEESEPVEEKDLKEWHPPVMTKDEAEASDAGARAAAGALDREEAKRQLDNLTDLLQKQIDELNREDAEKEEAGAAEAEAQADLAASIAGLTEEEAAGAQEDTAATQAGADETVLADTEVFSANAELPAEEGASAGESVSEEEAGAAEPADTASDGTAGRGSAAASNELVYSNIANEPESPVEENTVSDGQSGEDQLSDEVSEPTEAEPEPAEADLSKEGSDYDLLADGPADTEDETAPGPIGDPELAAEHSESAILAGTVAQMMAEDQADRAAKKPKRSDEAAMDAELSAMMKAENPEGVVDLGAEEKRPESDLLPHDYDNTIDLGEVDLSAALAAATEKAIDEDAREEEEKKKESDDYVSEDGLQQAIAAEYSDSELTEDEKEAFTYFTPISGMEKSLAMLLMGVRARYKDSKTADRGNIIIMGGHGSGKTTLATSIIKVLQKEIGKPGDRVGKIDGDKLNSKDIQKLFAMVSGGCLIIENAGDMTRNTAVNLSLLMANDTSGMLVILEDSHEGMKKALALDGNFSNKFTEKISIPALTIDELVNFGEAYAKDLGYTIDEMGVLALYDRINRILRLDHPTYLTEVKEIVDEAIDRAEHGSFFARVAGKKFDDKGRRILQEKHFV